MLLYKYESHIYYSYNEIVVREQLLLSSDLPMTDVNPYSKEYSFYGI